MGEIPRIILLIILIIWLDTRGAFFAWCEPAKQIYRDLYPFVGKPNQIDPDAEGGAVWWKPPGLELLSSISLFDLKEDNTVLDRLQADICMKLYAGYRLCPSNEAIVKQIQQLSAIPGVTYHVAPSHPGPCGGTFQITANSAYELLNIAQKMTRITQGLEPNSKSPGKIRDRLQNYTREHMIKT